eukprot:GHUV01013745.1.p1 GENE.GHUV01013745.1~~GHUV01013745.1.p1  ORF type:complete len:129 (+),score=33.96 GHUV01013745.1:80-466(+)
MAAALHSHCMQRHATFERLPARQHVCCSRVSRSVAAAAAKGPVVVIDNYDSFTYNLCQYLGDLGADFVVFKNDEKTVDEIRAMNPAGVLVSPGPGGRTGFAVVGVQRMWLCSLQWGVAVGTMVVVTLL